MVPVSFLSLFLVSRFETVTKSWYLVFALFYQDLRGYNELLPDLFSPGLRGYNELLPVFAFPLQI